MEIIFLGTGGGRWTTITQKLRTGGFRVHDSLNIHIDPGPGAIVGLKEMEINPVATDGVIVSHCHPDHYTDAEILLEAMTNGMTKKRGVLLGSKSVIEGEDNLGPAISRYHTSKLDSIITLKKDEPLEIEGMKIKTHPTRHSDSTAVGLTFDTTIGRVGYTSDTEYFEGLEQNYLGSRVLILNVIRPKNKRIPWHMCSDDVITLVEEVRPELAIMQHFGAIMVDVLDEEVRRVESETGVNTISARDFMRIEMDEETIAIHYNE